MKQIITVTGMHCAHCAAAVEQSLCALPDVKKAKVITVEKEVPADAIRKAVESAGFECGDIALKKGLLG